MDDKLIQAFPFVLPSQILKYESGMTLRDYFAAQALQGMCSGEKWPLNSDGPDWARRAYRIADAMLEERNKCDEVV